MIKILSKKNVELETIENSIVLFVFVSVYEKK